MPINLTKPLAWKTADSDEWKLLQNLQGNILKGHGRVETINIFFRIDPAKAASMRRALREVANFHVTSAAQQLRETEEYQRSGRAGATFVALFLANTGYAALGLAASAPKGEPQFLKGMRDDASLKAVGDKPVTQWEAPFQKQCDGMLLVGDMDRNRVRLKRDILAALMDESGATIVHEQRGSAIKDKANNGIEHFGYVDGRSQPLLLKEDVDKESRDAGISRWDPSFGLQSALVKDSDPDPTSFGSYFIFRKLEQDVQGFKRREQELATQLGLKGDEQRELAGALAVGRFEDGTPVTLSDEAKELNPPNDFNYNGDSGSRCPLQAHIRKVNPRGSGPGGLLDERTHIMPRRGIPYEDVMRTVHPSDLPGSESLSDFDTHVKKLLPTGKVGLLFMAYNSSLSKQFVFTQASWANTESFAAAGVGLDPVIGQETAPAAAQMWRKTWDDAAAGNAAFGFHGFVTLRGGEYFFAPSLSFLKSM